MTPVLAAVAQMTSTPSVAQNIKVVLGLMERASKAGAKMLFLPEATDFIAPAAQVLGLSRSLVRSSNDFLDSVRTEAKRHELWVNVGIHETPSSMDPGFEGRCYNTNVVIAADGTLSGVYRKMHLFDVDLAPTGPTMKESNTTIPGKDLGRPVPNTPVGNLGLQTCYDLRFSRPAHALLSDTELPATALTYPSAFATHTGAAHWAPLLRARAIEGQCYVFGSAQIGEHFPGRRSYGYAMIVDPWGTIVAQCPQTDKPELCFAEVDPHYVSKIRREMPMGW